MRWILAVVLVLIPLGVWGSRSELILSSASKSVVCGPVLEILEVLDREFEESEQWRGYAEQSTTSLFVNQRTGSWTLLEYTSELACFLATGQGEVAQRIKTAF